MIRWSCTVVCVVGLLFGGVQAQVLTWEHPGADFYRVIAEGAAPVVVTEKQWTIPDALRSARSFLVEACNALGVCTPSAPLPNLPPPPPTNLQIGVLGNGIPSPGVGFPTAPTSLGAFTPPNGSVDVATDTTFTCSALGATSYQLVIGTTNPPVSGSGDAQTFTGTACAFNPTLIEAEQYYAIFSALNLYGTTTGAVQAIETVQAPVEFFTTYNWPTTGWSTFGITLEEGVATDALQVGSFDTQTDVKVTHADGSIKFAIVSVNITAAGAYGIKEGTEPATTFTPTVPTAAVAFTSRTSTTHTATMPASLGTDCWLDGPLVKECRNIVTPDNSPAGALANLRVYFDTRVYNDGKSRVDVDVENTLNTSTTDTALYGYDVTVNGASQFAKTLTITPGAATITAAAGNRNVTVTGHGLTSADEGKYVRLTTGTLAGQARRIRAILDANTIALEWYFGAAITGQSWELVNFLQHKQTRWRKTFAANGLTEAEITPDMDLLINTGAMWRYLSTITSSNTTPTGADLQSYPPYDGYRWEILGIGNHEFYMPAGGGREELGIRPMNQAQYMVHKTQALRTLVLRYSELAGSRRVHFRNPTTLEMVNLEDLPTFSASGILCCGNGTTAPAGAGPAAGDTATGYTAESGPDHQGTVSVLPYLLTGDRFHMDEMKFWAEWDTLGYGVSGRMSGTNALTMPDDASTNVQVRQIAWTVRDLADAAAWLPDTDEHKTHFTTLLQANLDNVQGYSTGMAATDDPILLSKPFIQRTTLGGFMQGFMQIYVATALHHAARLGFTATGGGTDARDKIVAYWVQRMQDTADWPLEDCCPYYLYWKANAVGGDGQPFDTLAEQYIYNDTLPVPHNNCCTSPGGTASTPFFPSQPGGNPRYGETRILAIIGLDIGTPGALTAYTNIEALMDTVKAGGSLTWRELQLNDINYHQVGPAFAFDRLDQ